jgi:hypothetical protein
VGLRSSVSAINQSKTQIQYSNMKSIMKLASLGAFIATFGWAAGYADDPQLQERLALQRAQDTRTGLGPTVALYGSGSGIGRAKNDARPKLRFEIHYNPDGQAFGVYVPAE